MGVEPTERRFPDVPLALKARRVTGPYSLPQAIINQPGASLEPRLEKDCLPLPSFSYNHIVSTAICYPGDRTARGRHSG